MTLELHPEARKEYLASIVWYEKQVEDLGAEFFREIEKSFDRMLADPERYRLVDKLLRVIKVPRSPYSIFYRWNFDQSHIFVTTAFHHERHPDSRQKRPTG